MAGPAAYPLAAVMAVTALYCAGRLAVAPFRGRTSERGADLLHLVMGTAMAAMLLGAVNPDLDLLWLLGFAAAALWFVRAGVVGRLGPVARRHSLQHGAGCLAMVAMGVAMGASAGPPRMPAMAVMPTMPAMPGGPGLAGSGALTALAPSAVLLTGLALALVALAVPDLVAVGRPGPPAVLAPRCAAACRVAMSVTMGLALLTLL